MLAGGALDGLSPHDRRRRRSDHAGSARRDRVGQLAPDASARACRIRAATATTRACSASTSRQRHVVTLEEAIRKMTSLPAAAVPVRRPRPDQDGLRRRSRALRPAPVRDRATFEQPHAYPAGIPYVLVNGVPVVVKGEQTNARPGVVLTPAPAVPAPAVRPGSGSRAPPGLCAGKDVSPALTSAARRR